MSLIDELKKRARSRFRPARKGEAGYAQRHYVLQFPKDAVEAALSIPRRLFRETKQIGKKLETAAAERRVTAPREVTAKRDMAAMKRRETYIKKRKYKGESAKDIARFEKFKAKRMERHIGVHGTEVGGSHTPEVYAWGKAFAEKHADVEQDFLKYVESPPKKRSTKRRLWKGPRTDREAVRLLQRSQLKRRAA